MTLMVDITVKGKLKLNLPTYSAVITAGEVCSGTLSFDDIKVQPEVIANIERGILFNKENGDSNNYQTIVQYGNTEMYVNVKSSFH